jgi:hypothetical protein
MSRTLDSPHELRRRAAELAAHRPHPSAPEREALIEAAFRLAVHPETDPDEAVELLTSCAVRDPVNPRYAFHLARIHLALGDLETARGWMGQAVAQCPTSHRVWAHLALLQWELNERYAGKADLYEPNGLARRGDAIATAIRAGADEFPASLADTVPPEASARREQRERDERHAGKADRTPPTHGAVAAAGSAREPARVPRLDRPDTCRWSGVDDLVLERLLEATPDREGLRARIERLERIARAAGGRAGGIAAFAIASIQWVAAGYPSSTVRRLRALLPPSDPPPPSLEMLDLVCNLVEAPDPEFPGRLARAFTEGQLPPLLTACLHRLRLIPTVDFRGLGTYLAARRLLAESRDRGSPDAGAREAQHRRANELAATLCGYVNTIVKARPKPPADIASAPQATPLAPVAVRERLDEFKRAATALQDLLDRTFRFLSKVLEPMAQSGSQIAQARCDRAVLGTLLAEIEQAGKDGG